jgi:mRNA interferase RelE/StbE
MYEILFSRKASRFVKTLEKGYKEKIRDILGNLRENPFSYPHKKIRGETNMYRIRVGKYRILYEVDEKRGVIAVLEIDKRSRVYR